MSDPRETLARIRAQADAATEGPWEHEPPPGPGEDPMRPICVYPKEDGGTLAYVQPLEADAEFIAAARTNVPALLDLADAALDFADRLDAEAADDLRGTPAGRALMAEALEEEAYAMDVVISNGDAAEVAAPVSGETGRGSAVAARDALYENPAQYLRNRARIYRGGDA